MRGKTKTDDVCHQTQTFSQDYHSLETQTLNIKNKLRGDAQKTGKNATSSGDYTMLNSH